MREKVIEILNSVNSKIGKDCERDLLQDGDVDSYEIVNIVMALEDGLEIEIDPELIVADNFKSINAICEMINKIC